MNYCERFLISQLIFKFLLNSLEMEAELNTTGVKLLPSPISAPVIFLYGQKPLQENVVYPTSIFQCSE